MNTYTINYPRTGAPIVVTAKFIAGYPDTRDQPGEPDGAEIVSAVCDGADVTETLKDQEYDEIQELWMEAHYSAMPVDIEP